LIKQIYKGRGYIFTGLVFGIIYPLLHGHFENEAIISGLLIGGITGLIMSPFHKKWQQVEAESNQFYSNPKNFIRPLLIGLSIFIIAALIAHYLIF